MPDDYEQIKAELHAMRLVLKLVLEEPTAGVGGWLNAMKIVKKKAITAAARRESQQAVADLVSGIP
jgi:hypothetical protein